MVKNLKTQNKILISFIGMIAVFSVLIGYILLEYHSTNEKYNHEINYALDALHHIAALHDGYAAMLGSSNTFFMNLGNDDYLDQRMSDLET